MTDIRMFDFALPVASLGPLNIPATGGGWFDYFLFNSEVIDWFVAPRTKSILCLQTFDDNLPDLDFIGALKYWRQTVNSKYSFSKLAKFDFSKQPLKNYLNYLT